MLRLNEVCDAKQRTLNEKKEALEQLAGITDHCVEFVNGALEAGSDTAVLHAKHAICAHLQRIKSRRADIPNPEIPVRISLSLDKLPDLVRGTALALPRARRRSLRAQSHCAFTLQCCRASEPSWWTASRTGAAPAGLAARRAPTTRPPAGRPGPPTGPTRDTCTHSSTPRCRGPCNSSNSSSSRPRHTQPWWRSSTSPCTRSLSCAGCFIVLVATVKHESLVK